MSSSLVLDNFGLSSTVIESFIYEAPVLSVRTVLEKCPLVKSIRITSADYIMPGAFADCSGVVSADLPDTRQEWYDSWSALFGDNTTTKDTLSAFTILPTTGNALSIGNSLFKGCSALAYLDIPNNTYAIGDSAFEGNPIHGIDLSTTDVSTIGECAFATCTALSTIVIGEKVEDIGASCFAGCTSLSSFDFNHASLRSLGTRSFKDCTNLSTIDIVSAPITSYGTAVFENCTAVTDFAVPSALNPISLDEFGISTMTSLRRIDFRNNYILSDAITNDLIRPCGGLSAILFPPQAHLLSTTLSNMYNLSYIELPKMNVLSAIGLNVLPHVTSLSIPEPTGGIVEVQDMFTGNQHLEQIYFAPNISLSVGAKGFYDCSYLQYIDFGADGDIIFLGDNTFQNCRVLDRINLGKSTMTDIGEGAFLSCTNLTAVDFPPNLSVLSPAMISGCARYADFNIPASVSAMYDFGAATITSYTEPLSISHTCLSAFDDALNARSAYIKVTFKDGVCALKHAGDRAFTNVWATQPSVVFSQLSSIGEQAFANIHDLVSVSFGPSCSFTSIPASCFLGNTSLSVSLSSNSPLTSIGDYAFAGDIGAHFDFLTSLTAVEEVGAHAFEGCATDLGDMAFPASLSSIGDYAFAGNNYKAIAFGDSVSADFGVGAFASTYIDSLALPAAMTADTGFIDSKILSSSYGITSIRIPVSYKALSVFESVGKVVPTNAEYADTEVRKTIYKNLKEKVFGLPEAIDCTIYLNDDYYYDKTGTYATTNYNCLKYSDSTKTLLVSCDTTEADFGMFVSNPQLTASLLSIGDYALSGLNQLSSIGIPATVKSIGTASLSGCSSISALEIASAQLASVGHYAFADCSSLTSFATNGLAMDVGSYAFNGCTGLSSIAFAGSIPGTGQVALSAASLAGMPNMKSLTFSDAEATEVTAFSGEYKDNQLCAPVGMLVHCKPSYSYNSTFAPYIVVNTADATEFKALNSYLGVGTDGVISSVASNSTATSFALGVDELRWLSGIATDAFKSSSNVSYVGIPSAFIDPACLIETSAFSGSTGLTAVSFAEDGKQLNDLMSLFPGKTITQMFSYFGLTSGQKMLFADYDVNYDGTMVEHRDVEGPVFIKDSTQTKIVGLDESRSIPGKKYSLTADTLLSCLDERALANSLTLSSVGANGINTINNSALADSQVQQIVLDSLVSIAPQAFHNANQLGHADFPGSLAGHTFPACHLNTCSKLMSASFGEGLTSIADYALEGAAVRDVKFPSTMAVIGRRAFADAAELSGITGSNAASLTAIGLESFNSTALPSVDFTAAKFSTIEYGTFANCTKLSSAAFGDVTLVANNAFSDDSALSLVTFTSPVIAIKDKAFMHDLAEVQLSAVVIGVAHSVNVKLVNGATVNDNPFELSDGSIIKFKDYNKNNYMYAHGGKLHSVFSDMQVDPVTRTLETVSNSATNITVPAFVQSIAGSAFSGHTNLARIDGLDASLTEDASFSGCTSLTSINSNQLTSIQVGQFSGCSKLTSLTIAANVTTIPYTAFNGCSKLEFAFGDSQNITSIGHDAFNGCRKLGDHFQLGGGIYLDNIGTNAFAGTNSSTLRINNYYTTFMNGHESEFKSRMQTGNAECVYIFNDVRCDENGNLIIADDGLYYDTAKTTVIRTIPDYINAVTAIPYDTVTKIGNYAFNSCYNLQYLVCSTPIEEIGDYAFYNCTNFIGLADSTMEVSVKASKIGAYAFSNCKSMDSVILDSPTSVGAGAFYGAGVSVLTIKTTNKDLVKGIIGWSEDNKNPLGLSDTCQIVVMVGSNIYRYDYLMSAAHSITDIDINKHMVIYGDKTQTSLKALLITEPTDEDGSSVLAGNSFHCNIIGRWK